MRTVNFALVAAISLTALAACNDGLGTGVDEANEIPYAEGSPEAKAILAVANDTTLGVAIFDDEMGLDARAAKGIIAHRDGADPESREDDDPFDNLKELYGISYCKTSCLERILQYAKDNGRYGGNENISVVFSPQESEQSHLVEIAETIDREADETIDIAMYSYSHSNPVRGALERAIARGVKVRFLADTDLAKSSSKAGGLEELGIDVRRVTKIMHHKFAIIDGPRDDASLGNASTAHIISGSGNWSSSAATIYDENTLFMSGYAELALRLQRDFDTLWAGSKDIEYAPLEWDQTRGNITDELIAENDDPNTDALLTSFNFKPTSSQGWSVLGTSVVSDALAEAIGQAQSSIRIASAHLVSEPIAQALLDALSNNPSLTVEIALDCQETSKGGAISDIKKAIEDRGGSILYKCNTYRWHYVYAQQLHHKYVIVDDQRLFTGSYNFSENAEDNTFENVLMFEGAEHAALIASYVQNHDMLKNYGHQDDMQALTDLREEIESGDSVPLNWSTPIAMDLDTFLDLKDLIRDNCPATKSWENTPEAKTYNKYFNTQPQWFSYCKKTGYPWPNVPVSKRVQ